MVFQSWKNLTVATVSKLLHVFVLNYIKDEVCYPPYGCFNKTAPFNASYIPLPDNPIYLDTSFTLYNRDGSQNMKVSWDDKTTIPTAFDNEKKLVVIAHGFLEHGSMPWMKAMVDGILADEDSNVILVNWKKGANFPYNKAVANIRIVGSQIAHLLEHLIKNTVLKPEDIHLIGFSLGAHLMGNVGSKLIAKNMKVKRITGLDPAGPFFEQTPTDFRLDPQDGGYVDVIHTDTNTIPFHSIGLSEICGHSDFFPNGGYDQPGCEKISFDLLTSSHVTDLVSCSHYRSVYYFIESIKDRNTFQSYTCNSYKDFKRGKCYQCIKSGNCDQMGYYTNMNPGIYYLMTNAETPFSGLHYHIAVSTGKKLFADTSGIVEIQLIGDNGSSDLVKLDKNTFKRKSLSTFTIFIGNYIGGLKQMKIKHKSGFFFKDDWYVSEVEVALLKDMSKRFIGCVNNWIGDSMHMVTLKNLQKTC